MKEKKSLKDKITNYLSMIVAGGTIVISALGSVPESAEWYVWVGAALFAIFGWVTGKKGDLKGSAE